MAKHNGGHPYTPSRSGRERCESEIRRIALRRARAEQRCAAALVAEALDPDHALFMFMLDLDLDRDDLDDPSNPYHDHVEAPVHTLLEVARFA